MNDDDDEDDDDDDDDPQNKLTGKCSIIPRSDHHPRRVLKPLLKWVIAIISMGCT